MYLRSVLQKDGEFEEDTKHRQGQLNKKYIFRQNQHFTAPKIK